MFDSVIGTRTKVPRTEFFYVNAVRGFNFGRNLCLRWWGPKISRLNARGVRSAELLAPFDTYIHVSETCVFSVLVFRCGLLWVFGYVDDLWEGGLERGEYYYVSLFSVGMND